MAVRLPLDLHAAAKGLADATGTSLAAWIIDAMRAKLAPRPSQTEDAGDPVDRFFAAPAPRLPKPERQREVVTKPDPKVQGARRQVEAVPAKASRRWNAPPGCKQCGAPLQLGRCPIGCT